MGKAAELHTSLGETQDLGSSPNIHRLRTGRGHVQFDGCRGMDHVSHVSTKMGIVRGADPEIGRRDISTEHLDAGRISLRMEDRQIATEFASPGPGRLVILGADEDRNGCEGKAME